MGGSRDHIIGLGEHYKDLDISQSKLGSHWRELNTERIRSDKVSTGSHWILVENRLQEDINNNKRIGFLLNPMG